MIPPYLIAVLLLILGGLFATKSEVRVHPIAETELAATTTTKVGAEPRKMQPEVLKTKTAAKTKGAAPQKTTEPAVQKTTPPATAAPHPQEPTAGATGSVALSSDGRPQISIPELEMRIHELINKERQAQGLSPLAWNPSLLPIARGHSQDMSDRGYFAHNSPDGETFSDRYAKGDFQCAIEVGTTIYGGAENLFQNNLWDSWHEINGVRTYDWNSLQKIAESSVDGWMHSPGHRANILTPYWQSEAIGVVFAANDQVLITQNFC